MKRKHKKYSKPKRPFDKVRIDEEVEIKKEYGLKNKKEIWKAEAKINSMRSKAKKLIKASPEEQKALFKRLQKVGLKVESIADVLGLDKKDYLERRLQTVVYRKGLANTMKTARQLIVHKKVLIEGNVVNIPSFIVPLDLENKIEVKKKKIKKKEEKVEESEKEESDDKEKNTEGEKKNE